ncbi:hypothetical protein VXM60_16425 [Shewanella khirikhana]|uniref:GGDEF domain-containing protein n=1 Tax=Shewanella khirikhana TaxID=1965282 RepID=UPI0030CC9A5C
MSLHPVSEWLLEHPHPAIDEPRWHQLTQLLCQLFKASASALVQYHFGDARLISVKQNKNVGLTQGAIEPIDHLKQRLSNTSLPDEGIWRHGLIELPLHWPGGGIFGAVLLVCDKLPPNLDSCQTLAAPIIDYLQSELKVYRQARQMEQLSLQDEATQMLNSHGFNLMAPRQLNLSRRLGSHAGLVLMENGTEYQGHEAEEKLRSLAQVVFDNLREADLAARIGNQIVLLAFVDSEANLDSLVTRLRKQFARKLEPQRVLTGHSFFTPDSHLELGPMMAQANDELQTTRARLYPKAVISKPVESLDNETLNISEQFTATEAVADESPVEDMAEPVEDAAEPVEDVTESVDDVTEPVEEVTEDITPDVTQAEADEQPDNTPAAEVLVQQPEVNENSEATADDSEQVADGSQIAEGSQQVAEGSGEVAQETPAEKPKRRGRSAAKSSATGTGNTTGSRSSGRRRSAAKTTADSNADNGPASKSTAGKSTPRSSGRRKKTSD